MVFFTALPSNNPEDDVDDMLLYADDVTAEGNDAVTDLTTNTTLERSVILIDTDSEKPANLTNETQIISSLVLAWHLSQILFSLQMGFFTALPGNNPEDDHDDIVSYL
ncbi:Uncharacterized protein APZ42_005347, partial [Daphnia magna]